MSKINVKGLIETDLNNLWSRFEGKSFTEIPPYSIKEISEAELVFIGLNPSLSDKKRAEILNKNGEVDTFYDFDYSKKDTHSPYFKKFYEIADATGTNWCHQDLLFIRETKQKNILALLEPVETLDFIYTQLLISKRVLDKLIESPLTKIFIVSNTLSREFLGKDRPDDYSKEREHWMDYRFEWSEDLGTYLCQGKVFFFTSMLTGQRALDKGSLKRLKWHINFVKSKIK